MAALYHPTSRIEKACELMFFAKDEAEALAIKDAAAADLKAHAHLLKATTVNKLLNDLELGLLDWRDNQANAKA